MLRAPKRKEIVLRPVRPNEGLAAAYRKKLEALVEAMHRSIMRWVIAAYRARAPELAQDESPAANMQRVMQKLKSRWQSRFDQAAPELAKYFAQKQKDRSDSQLKQILKDGGFAVEFKMTRAMQDVMTATIGQQVGLIRNLSQQHLNEIEGLVMRSVQVGRDLGTLSKQLEHRYGMTKRRAALIARDQSNKASATMNRARQIDLGIKEAIWQHSHAGKEPRKEHMTWSRERKRYNIAQGMWSDVDGEYVWPGTAINCRCIGLSIVPGFDWEKES
jgi:uncharacterized protein with gpF-like domain